MEPGEIEEGATEYNIKCVVCGEVDTVHHDIYLGMQNAKKDFIESGWKKVKGKWTCKDCQKSGK